MPTVILFDASLSMSKTLNLTDSNEAYTCQKLANYGLIGLLDHMSTNTKLEYVSLMYFSSLWERSVFFTRDYEMVKLALANNCDTFYDSTSIVNALNGVNNYIVEEWGNKIPVQILLITDGQPGLSALASMRGKGTSEVSSPFTFPAKLHVINMCIRKDSPLLDEALAFYRRLIMDTCGLSNPSLVDEHIWYLDAYSLSAVSMLFQKLAERDYRPFHAALQCGSMETRVNIYPPLQQHTNNADGELVVVQPSERIQLHGFIELSELASPSVQSRHLIMPEALDKTQLQSQLHSLMTLTSNTTGALGEHTLSELEHALESLSEDELKQPSLAVLLHASLKVEGMAALCKIGEPNWYGMLYALSDTKKKSNLMLSTFKCGLDAIAWLDDFNSLGVPTLNPKLSTSEIRELGDRKSYAQTCTVWIQPTGLHSDIQKVLRWAKKLPEKNASFYKELTKFRKAALTIGFHGIITGLAQILERECTLLPGTAHPEAALQLTHAVSVLRTPCTIEQLHLPITPLKTRFNAD